MTIPAHRVEACKRKRNYSSKREAKKDIKRMSIRKIMTYYDCPCCDYWHVSTKKGKKKQNK